MFPTQERHALLAVFAHAPMGVALLREPDHRLDYWNEQFDQFFPGARAGATVKDALPDLASEEVLGQLDRLYQSGETYQSPVARLPGPGEARYVTFTYQPYREQEKMAGVALFVQDVTAQELARQRAEQTNQELTERVQTRTQELAASNEEYRQTNAALLAAQLQLQQLNAEQHDLLRQILRQVPAAIATLSGPEHRFTFANARYQDLVGHRVTVGQTVAEALPEVREQGVLELLDRVYQTGEPFIGREIVIMLEQPPGPPHHHHYDLSYLPLRDRQGVVQSILVFAVEVSEQVRIRRQTATLQAALLASAQRQAQERQDLFQVFEQTPAAIVLLREPSHTIDYYNPAFAATFPPETLAADALRGRTLAEVYPRMQQAGLVRLLDEVFATGEPQVVLEMPLAELHPGSPRYVTFAYQAYREQGRIVGVAAFIYDATEQVLARQARDAQQRLMESVFAQAPTAVWVVQGPDYVFELVNPLMAQLLGRSVPQLLGRPYFEVLPELADQGLLALFGRVWEQGEPIYVEELAARLVRHAPGETGYFNFVFQPLRDEQGQVSRIACVAVDVTDQVSARRQVEQLNQELEQRVAIRTQELSAAQASAERERALLQAMFTQAPVAIALLRGPDVRVASANERMAALWGRTPAQVVGQPLLAAVPELVGQGFDELLRAVETTGVPYVGTEVPAQIQQHGQLVTRYYNFVCQAIYDALGTPLGVINIGVDVTEQVTNRRQLEQLNQELEQRVATRTQELSAAQQLAELRRQRLERLFLAAPAAICILNGPTLIYELVNPAYQALFPGRELFGLPLLEALPELTDQPVWHSLQQVYRTGQTHQELGILIPVARTPGGPLEDRYFNYIQQSRFTADGQVDGALVFAFDVTEQVLARQQVDLLNGHLAAINQELTVTNAQLQRTNADLDTFIYTASHDLKTPIANVEGLVLALRRALPAEVVSSAPITHLLQLMDASVARFQQTLGQLTDVIRLQQAHPEPAAELLLAPVLEAVRQDLAGEVAVSGAILQLDVPAAASWRISVANLRSILYNLLSNALKYRVPDRTPAIHVALLPGKEYLELTVTDNGLGLTAAQQGHLFQLFRRLHAHVAGSGVGLYTVKKIVDNLGGTIAVQSAPQVGTTFTVRLPAGAAVSS